MTNSTSLAEIKDKYKGSNVNLLLPMSYETRLNPFYKLDEMVVQADISDNSGDIFNVGRVKVGYDSKDEKSIYADVFSPAKPLLMKLATAAGIQFDPNHTYGEYISKNCYRAKAYGAIRLPDGTGKTHADEKVINLEDEEDRLRLEFMDKSIEGIADWRAAKAAAQMFKGKWITLDEKDDKGYPVKKYVIDDSDRQKYIDRSMLVNMTQLRKTFAEKAMTGAILRVVRALVGLKGTYTKEELGKPFVVPRVTFSPDYNDPIVRQAMLEQGMNSMSNMFGSTRPIMAASSQLIDAPGMSDGFNPEEFQNNAAFQSDLTDDPADDFSPSFGDNAPQSPNDDVPLMHGMAVQENDIPPCSECGKAIDEKVYTYSIKRLGRPLCYGCQKKEQVAK